LEPNFLTDQSKKKFISLLKAEVGKIAQSLDPVNFVLIETSRGLEVIVDAKHKNEVSKYRWFAVVAGGNHIYAVADIDEMRVSLQRFIVWLVHPDRSLKDTKHISFMNKVTFDCRSANLTRKATRQTVMQNRRPKKNTSSKYKGVIKSKRTDGGVAWRAQIKGHLGSMTLGTFEDEIVAAIHYDAAAYVMFHNSGYYNFPETTPNLKALDHVKLMIERRRRKIERKEANWV
jgi:hypothetical protein